MANLRNTLMGWRDNEAAKKGVELFRVLPNSAIDDIVRVLPKNKEELTAIKGIKDAKFLQYGIAILNLVKEHSRAIGPNEADTIIHIGDGLPKSKQKEERVFHSVSSYLDIINRELWRLRASIKGEVTSFKFQGSAVYFSIRDNEDGATLSVFMWMNDYSLAGIELAEGLEVVVEGRSEIYKPSGRFNFRAETIELVGEGAFKKAYDEVRKRLHAEGLFDLAKKRELGKHPVRIGLVTSRAGAVIHDFLNNLGRYGFQITFIDARVEGASAVKEILSALTYLESKNLDALVLVRGGGSLESLQAFNNEFVVRKIATFPAVTICAIGHDKDVPLAQLAADYAPSTPTATTILLNASWAQTIHEISETQLRLVSQFTYALSASSDELRLKGNTLEVLLEKLFEPFLTASTNFSKLLFLLVERLTTQNEILTSSHSKMLSIYYQHLKNTAERVASTASVLSMNDPMRQLKLGFSIISKNGKILRDIADIAKGDSFEARVVNGTLVGIVEEKHNKPQ